MSDPSDTDGSSGRATPAPEYYVIDHSKVTIGELWRFFRRRPNRWIYTIQVLVAKLLRRPIRSGVPVLLNNARIIELTEIPQEIRGDFEAVLRSLESMGFTRILVISQIMARRVTGFDAVLLSTDGLCWARAGAFQVGGGSDVRKKNHLTFYTQRRNGHALCTTTIDRQGDDTELATERLPKASPDLLLQRHRRRVLDCTDVQPIHEAELRDRISKNLQRANCEEIETHGFVPATSAEIQQYRNDVFISGE